MRAEFTYFWVPWVQKFTSFSVQKFTSFFFFFFCFFFVCLFVFFSPATSNPLSKMSTSPTERRREDFLRGVATRTTPPAPSPFVSSAPAPARATAGGGTRRAKSAKGDADPDEQTPPGRTLDARRFLSKFCALSVEFLPHTRPLYIFTWELWGMVFFFCLFLFLLLGPNRGARKALKICEFKKKMHETQNARQPDTQGGATASRDLAGAQRHAAARC
jgi:hypothetical protein